MKIKKYQKNKKNEYKIYTDKGDFTLYDDIIVKNELLLKKEVSNKEWESILKENQYLKAYYEAIKIISIKMRTEKEIRVSLARKNFKEEEIEYTINKLKKEGYINRELYIETYIHDRLSLYLEGEKKIYNDLIKMGFMEEEIKPYLEDVEEYIYQEKIEKYISKKAKVNKKSIGEFKRKTFDELIKKGFLKEDINYYLNNINLEENVEELEKIINKLYNKYIKKYDLYTTKLKIKNYLYQKGYIDVDIDNYLDN